MKRIKVGWLLLYLMSAISVAHAQGVGTSGDIYGTVTDPQGAAAPKATVTAIEVEKGIRRSTVTDSSGQYRLAGLLPASYDVSVELAGFSTEIQKNVVVSVGETTVVDFHLTLSKVASTVEVTSAAPIVDIEQAHQANSIDETYISDLPINRRDYLTYTLLVPGVSNSTRLASDLDFRVKQTPQSGLSFYGSNGRGNSVTVDGGEADDDAGGVRLTVSQEAVQEFQVNRSNYSADLGGASGASINIVTKSGTNNLHGSLFGLFRNDALDARDPFAFTQALAPGIVFDPTKPALGQAIKNSLNRQQFGGSAGFPIQEDKTFLFLSFEGLRQDAQNAVPILTNTNIFLPESDPANNQVGLLNAIASIPGNPMVPCFTKPLTFLPAQTCALALGSGLTVSQFTGGLFPGQNLINQYIVSQFEGNGGLFNFNTREYLASARLDHEFGANDHASLRYSYGHDSEQNPDVQSLTGFSRGSSVHAYDNTLLGSWFHAFSPTFQNEARLQWNYSTFNVIPNEPGQVGLDIPGFANLGTQIFLPSLTIMRRFEAADSLTWIRGNHTMKFGGQFLYRGNHTESHTFFPGRFVFGSLPGFFLSPCFAASTTAGPNPCGLTTAGASVNAIQSVSLAAPQFFEQGFGNPIYSYPRPFGAFFWQDSWKILPNFTLNYGLRYEIDGQYGPLATDKDNFAPRISFAWDPFKNHKTVVRGGFGIFYSPVYGQIADVVQTLGNINNTRQIANILVPGLDSPIPGVTSQTVFLGLFFNSAGNLIKCTTPTPPAAACITPAALAPLGVTVSNTGPLPPLTVVFSGQPGYQSPYSEQAEFGIEREIGAGFVVSASYIYVHTLKLPVAIDTNAVPQPFQFVNVPLANGSIARYRDWNTDPLLDPFGGAPCQGAAILNCFVNPLILQADQYSSQASALFQGGILEIKRRFTNHFTLFGNYTYSKAFDTTTDFNSDFGPQDNTNLGLERGLSTFDQRHKVVLAGVFDSPWKNPAIAGFELSPIFTYNSGHPFTLLAGADVNGDRHSTNDRPIGAGRNTGLGPNFIDFDMRLSRTFRFAERYSVQLLAEGFNLANRTNFASVNNVVGPAFGLPVALGGGGAKTFNVHGSRNISPSQPLGFTSDFPKRQIQLGVQFRF